MIIRFLKESITCNLLLIIAILNIIGSLYDGYKIDWIAVTIVIIVAVGTKILSLNIKIKEESEIVMNKLVEASKNV